ncbi:hypothetical protein JW710_04285 [Candidatus Dojkabacteria bacterium]|nr:hypothetical protein [Candidatus Dojkabacteria bacterium]
MSKKNYMKGGDRGDHHFAQACGAVKDLEQGRRRTKARLRLDLGLYSFGISGGSFSRQICRRISC